MIQWITDKIEKRKADEIAAQKSKRNAEVLRLAAIKSENIEDYTQSLRNTMYLRSSINVTRSNVHNVKGRSGAETKQKKEFLRGRIKWMERKLIEELEMVELFKSMITG
jgi:hypothetical protein